MGIDKYNKNEKYPVDALKDFIAFIGLRQSSGYNLTLANRIILRTDGKGAYEYNELLGDQAFNLLDSEERERLVDKIVGTNRYNSMVGYYTSYDWLFTVINRCREIHEIFPLDTSLDKLNAALIESKSPQELFWAVHDWILAYNITKTAGFVHIAEGNSIIADFMGDKSEIREYHTDYNRMMQVIRKIQSVWDEVEELDELKSALFMLDLEQVWKIVYDLINIYNGRPYK